MNLLTIIIINYKSRHLLLNCLETVFDQTDPALFELIVVDNDSRDDSRTAVLTKFPTIRWIDMDYNAGFARANNAGIRAAKGDTVLLLNADTLIRDRAIEQCYAALSSAAFAAAGIQLLNADGSPQISGLFDMKGGLNYLLPLPLLGKIVKQLGRIAGVGKPHATETGVLLRVDWINGAFLMVKKEAIRKAGMLDPDFFLYAEEAEWCGRLRKTGPLCIFGNIHSIHLEGETVNAAFGTSSKIHHNLSDKKGLQIMLSNFLRIRKQFGKGWFLLLLLFYIAELPLYLIAALFSGRHSAYSMSSFRGYYHNLKIVLGNTRRIYRNQPHFYKVL